MVHSIPLKFAKRVKRHETALKRMTSKPDHKRSYIGGSLSKTLKQMLSLVLDGKFPLLSGLSGNVIRLIRKAVQSRRAIEQNGSGIFSILKHVIPVVLPMVLSLFKKKPKKT